jgi:hypothetical protein
VLTKREGHAKETLSTFLGVSMMSQTAAQRYRREAEECEVKAKRAEKWVDQEAWLRLAVDWKKLARAAEQTEST